MSTTEAPASTSASSAPSAAVKAPPQIRTWTGDRFAQPERAVSARTTAEVQAAVAAAAASGETLRVLGSGFSYSDVAHTTSVQLTINEMNRVLEIDPGAGRVRVQAGITLAALNEALGAAGLAMASLGEIQGQTLAGALATDTHGSGTRYGGLARSVSALQLVSGSGELVEIGEDDAELLDAARVSLGARGVLTEVTLEVEPAFQLRQLRRMEPLDRVLSRLADIAEGHDHPEVFVFPFARQAMVVLRDRTSAPSQPRSPRRRTFEDVVLQNRVVDLIGRAAVAAPRTTPALTRILATAVRPSERVEPSCEVFSNQVRFPVTSAEWALPAGSAVAAAETMLALYQRERFTTALPFLLRWGAPSSSLLSPCYGRDSVYLEVMAHGAGPAEHLLRCSEDRLADLGGRPHWGKPFRLGAAELAARYPSWERFQAVRGKLDPEGLFENEWTRRVLGPAR